MITHEHTTEVESMDTAACSLASGSSAGPTVSYRSMLDGQNAWTLGLILFHVASGGKHIMEECAKLYNMSEQERSADDDLPTAAGGHRLALPEFVRSDAASLRRAISQTILLHTTPKLAWIAEILTLLLDPNPSVRLTVSAAADQIENRCASTALLHLSCLLSHPHHCPVATVRCSQIAELMREKSCFTGLALVLHCLRAGNGMASFENLPAAVIDVIE